jgi:hypothetical protein
MFHPNLTQISQQLHMLPYPDGYEVRGLEPLSVRPYSFTMVLSNSLVNRIVTLRVDYDGMMPKFIVIQVNKKPCEEFELMSDFARVFEVSVKTVPVPVVEEIVEVHSVHVMNQQKDLLKNRLKVMLEGLYHPTTIEITHNDGISTEGYFVDDLTFSILRPVRWLIVMRLQPYSVVTPPRRAQLLLRLKRGLPRT